jgi:MoxR-like ATPase
MIHDIPDRVPIPPASGGPGSGSVHLFDEPSRWAVRAALAANRPLLVRGEPGVGKSQLAHAAAIALRRPFLSLVVNARTESQDLLYSFDAVRRLAQAQICSAIKDANPAELLAESKFLHPGKLWWAFDWDDAKRQAEEVRDPTPVAPKEWKPGGGCVVLIDEIDKAESDVPNGLLEALGSHCFPVRGRLEPVAVKGEPPLVVITTNEDRVLPNAFVRRCLVLHIELPENDELQRLLVERGTAHQPNVDEAVLEMAAEELVTARNQQRHLRPRPGQAEYLDLIRAVAELSPANQKLDSQKSRELLERVKGFVLEKSRGTPG